MRAMTWWLLLACGCIETRFTAGVAGYAPSPRASAPELFVDAAPRAPYRAVGTIVVEADPAVSARSMLAAALEAGRKAGCQLLVDRRLGAPLFSHLRRAVPGVLVAHEGDEARTAPNSNAPEHSPAAASNAGWQRRELICALWR